MKQKEIIEMLGRVGDSFADLAHVLKYVAVKNA
jgi:uncharacterized protein Yka (UPF0111/DUF47 family)